jgi:hypothetical protein
MTSNGLSQGLLARSLPLPIDEFGQIVGTNQPRRFLSSQPESLARKELCRRATLRFQRTQPKIFGGDLFQRDVRLSKLSQQTEVGAIHHPHHCRLVAFHNNRRSHAAEGMVILSADVKPSGSTIEVCESAEITHKHRLKPANGPGMWNRGRGVTALHCPLLSSGARQCPCDGPLEDP